MPQKILKIDEKNSGVRIDLLATKLFPGISRTAVAKHSKFVRGDAEFPGKTRTRTGEVWKIEFCDPSASENSKKTTPWEFDLQVLAESKSWLAINKPIGVSVHPSASENSQETIANALAYRFGGTDLKIQPKIVHRLDKTTSGVLLVAKTTEALRFFQKNWGKVEKIYTALVVGRVPASGRIVGGILRDWKNRTRMAVSDAENAKSAETRFWREDFDPERKISRVRVQILTGRTHQIRAHFAAIGFPILGDEKYGGRVAERVFLHARRLKFPDPDAGDEPRTVECSWQNHKL